VKQHITAGADVNAKDKYGYSPPLHSAALFDHKEIIELLIAAGADVNAKGIAEWTPLHNAAYNGHKEIVELLIEKGADVNAKDEDGGTPLDLAEEEEQVPPPTPEVKAANQEISKLLRKHGGKSGTEDSILIAARTGNIEAVKKHLADGVSVDGKNDDWTPLHHATFGGHKEVAGLLIAEGADVNAKDEGGQTPLHLAAFWGHKQIAAQLIAKGADVNAKTNNGETPLDKATNPDNPNDTEATADLLRKHGGNTGDWLNADKSIHSAARAGHIEAVKQHLAAGADVNAKLDRGYTALHYAAHEGHKEIAQLLIGAGADVNAKDDDGHAPLTQAAIDGHKKIVELLIGAGADVNATDEVGRTPLLFASANGHKEIVELLIGAGADVNAMDDNGDTPLDVAIEFRHPQIADLLRKHGGKTKKELEAAGN
jgi:ankyrin repeat protein